jgi:HD-GYP domain-containing protein (c-di-GMP phosphodiesterase class II)
MSPECLRTLLVEDEPAEARLADRVLLKPGPLDAEERAILQRHAEDGYNLLAGVDFLRPALDIPFCHHERWDGSGYPRGLKGEAIPLLARIFAVANAWDKLQCDRPGRSAWPADHVRRYLAAQAGRRFDPRLVAIFLQMRL